MFGGRRVEMSANERLSTNEALHTLTDPSITKLNRNALLAHDHKSSLSSSSTTFLKKKKKNESNQSIKIVQHNPLAPAVQNILSPTGGT